MTYKDAGGGGTGWNKAWFYLQDGTSRVVINSISPGSGTAGGSGGASGRPVYSVLDQKRHNGDVFVNGVVISPASTGTNNISRSGVTTLWHDSIGYAFDTPLGAPSAGVNISLYAGSHTGSWQTIGTSTAPPTTVDLFGAWITHEPKLYTASIGYTVFAGTSLSTFLSSKDRTTVKTINTPSPAGGAMGINTVLDTSRGTALMVFWPSAFTTVPSASRAVSLPFDGSTNPVVNVTADHPLTLIVRRGVGLTVADPSQTLTSAVIKLIYTGTAWTGTAAKKRGWTSRVPPGHGHGHGGAHGHGRAHHERLSSAHHVNFEKRATTTKKATPTAVVTTTRAFTVTFPTATRGASVIIAVT
jgi:hypothetical protein